MPLAMMWMDLEGVMLSEISQRDKHAGSRLYVGSQRLPASGVTEPVSCCRRGPISVPSSPRGPCPTAQAEVAVPECAPLETGSFSLHVVKIFWQFDWNTPGPVFLCIFPAGGLLNFFKL